MAAYSFGKKRSRRFKDYHFKSGITTRGLALRTSGRKSQYWGLII
jgi:hypothetical protein